MQSYNSLANSLNFEKALPYTKDWSAAADFLQLIADHCLQAKPETIIECSSGLSTLILARCCQLNKKGRVFSLENGDEYAKASTTQLDDFELAEFASVIHAPLKEVTINQQSYRWYSLAKLADKPIDMLVIDGPPGFIQHHSRYPAIPLLINRFSNECTVFLDDAARDDEKEIIKLWQAEYPNLEHEYIETERGCSILRINKEAR